MIHLSPSEFTINSSDDIKNVNGSTGTCSLHWVSTTYNNSWILYLQKSFFCQLPHYWKDISRQMNSNDLSHSIRLFYKILSFDVDLCSFTSKFPSLFLNAKIRSHSWDVLVWSSVLYWIVTCQEDCTYNWCRFAVNR